MTLDIDVATARANAATAQDALDAYLDEHPRMTRATPRYSTLLARRDTWAERARRLAMAERARRVAMAERA